MSYILDTSVAIPLRDGDDVIRAKLRALSGVISLSAITRVELDGGVHVNARNATIRQRRLDKLLAGTPTLDFGKAEAVAYGQIVAQIGYSRRKVIDRMIAAQAIVIGATLVTLNPDDFSDIPDLNLLAL
jgi:tRNA(fMet)-specific endonuclease VapC